MRSVSEDNNDWKWSNIPEIIFLEFNILYA
jgi:hypothetical protein